MFTHLKFKDFRGFSGLKLEGLQRVNLIVGRNNAGKTSLLEGIALLCNPNQLNQMPHLLRSTNGNVNLRYSRWMMREGHGVNQSYIKGSHPNGNRGVAFRKIAHIPDDTLEMHDVTNTSYFIFSAIPYKATLNCGVVSTQPSSQEGIVKLFAAAVKQKDGEELLENLLREVDSRIKKVRVYPFDDGNHVMVDFGLSEMLPLSQAGQGVQRLITMFSEMIGGRPDICIIDEIENGLHHSMLEQIWTGLAAIAETLNVQIFATTHSRECIEAAHAAFSARKSYDFSVVQLFRVEEDIQGRVLDREHIEAALEGGIDLR